MNRVALTRDPDIEQTKKLKQAIRDGKVKAFHALIKKGVYVDAEAYVLARAFMPEKVGQLDDHMRKTYYGFA